MATALIGHSGFVGGTLLGQTTFDDLYRSTNIGDIKHKEYSLVVCAGAPAAKWIANQNPQEDLRNLTLLMDALKEVRAQELVLISTVDVYPSPISVDEDSPIDSEKSDPYGKHRFYLEEFVRNHFEQSHIVRLPGLFGKGLKKNFLFDLLHHNALEFTHKDSRFQWYDMSRLWSDLAVVREKKFPLVNFAVEPVGCQEIAENCFGAQFENVPDKAPALYDMRTKYAAFFGSTGPYLYHAEEALLRIKKFVDEERARESK